MRAYVRAYVRACELCDIELRHTDRTSYLRRNVAIAYDDVRAHR